MEQLYQELLNIYKTKSSIEYEKRTEEARKDLVDKDFRFEYESFVPYPSYKNNKFNETIYKKQEFFRNKSLWESDKDYDAVVQDKCSGEFRATSNQKFIKNFMSPITSYKSLLIYHDVGTGKCHAFNTPILMADGSIKMVQDIQVNDELMGDDSKPRKVLSLAQGEDMMYNISQSHGETYCVNSEHILVLKDSNDDIHEIEVQDYLKISRFAKAQLFGYSEPVHFPDRATTKEPYEAALEHFTNIPEEYLKNSLKKRFCYLISLIRNYGAYMSDKIVINAVSKDLTYLARTLGFSVVIQDNKTILHKDSKSIITVTPTKIDKYYGFVLDGNHRYLLGDCTVTHNTCTAVNIAEQYYDTFEKRVLVILSGNIEENFKKQIYDINKLEQCTGTKYPDMVLDKHLFKKEELEKKIDNIIKQRYEFVGYKELAIYMENRKKTIDEQIKNPDNLPELNEKRKMTFTELLRERFSNRLIIIDEAHNLRLPSETGKKQISTAFLEFMQLIENVKIVLMTATPMYNTADEIVWMINLLLTNDRRKTIKRADLFDKNSNLTENGKKILKEVSRGYVTYMRGQNPYSFPFRLFPSINNPKDPNILTYYPQKDIYGENIPEELKIKFLEIITSKMSDYQYDIYNSFKKKIERASLRDDDDAEEVDENAANNDVQNTMQLSNVAYPVLDWQTTPTLTYGLKGFNNCFDISSAKVFRVKYKDHIKEKYGEFLSYDNLPKYAPKIKTIIDYIKNTKGIVFIYSRYYGAGLYPLVCALEHVGMSRYSIDGKSRNVLENGTVKDQFNNTKPKYCVLSRKLEMSPNNDLEIAMSKSKENLNGEIIKVILVSKIGTEGIDFKRIRDVHILEPWYNLNRAEQIIGRAVRTCSHVDLPKSQRNVTIYFHANMCPNKDEESVDLRTYRVSEIKQKRIIEVEDILKKSSIDCNLNKDVLLFTPNKLQISFDIETSQGKTIKSYKLGDRDYSFICGFKPCEFKCDPDIKPKVDIDNTTFDMMFISDDITLIKKYISKIYEESIKEKTAEDILKYLKNRYKLIEDDIVSFALEELVSKKTIINSSIGKGYLIYRSNKYIFQSDKLQDTRIALEDRDKVSKKKIELHLNKLKKPVQVVKVEELKEDKKVVIENLDDVFMTIYKKIVIFFLNIELDEEEVAGTKAYLNSISTKTDYEEIIDIYLKNHYKSIEPSDEIDKSLINRIKVYILQYDHYIYDAVVDRLNLDQLKQLYMKQRTEIEIKLRQTMERGKLILDKYLLSPIDKKLYKIKGTQVVECGPTDMILVKALYDEIKQQITDKPIKGKRLFTRWQKDKLEFKMRDTDATQGAVCTTSPKKEYLTKKLVDYVGKSFTLPDYSKHDLCLLLQVISRKTNDFQRALYLVSKN